MPPVSVLVARQRGLEYTDITLNVRHAPQGSAIEWRN